MRSQKLTLFLAFFALQSALFGQTWVGKAALPDTAFARHHPVTFSIDGYGYLLGGSATQSPYLSDFYRYDPLADQWEQLPDFPGPARSYSYAIVYNGKAYMGFGFGLTSDMSDLWEYDPIAGTWIEKALCPGDGRGHPAFLEANGKIYVGLGGGDLGNLKDFWEYDIATDQWEQMPDFPSYARHHPYHFSIAGMVYVAFGHGSESVNGSTIYRDIFRFDPQDDTWEQMEDFPGEQRVAGTQFAYNGKGYVLSGEGADHYYLEEGEFWEYDPVNDAWKQLPSMPGSGRWAPGSFVIGNTVYATCGTGFADGVNDKNQKDLWAYQLPVTSGTVIPSKLPYALEVYPNPAQDLVFVRGTLTGETHFQLMGADGRVIQRGRYSQSGIALAGLPVGIYGLLLQDGERRYQARFVKD